MYAQAIGMSIFSMDEKERPDPVSRSQPDGVHGASEVVDPLRFHWTDQNWRGLPLEKLILYELHVGTFSDKGTFDAIIPHLPYLRDIGITAIELMPIAQFSGARNWGYDGVGLFAPHSTYGGPNGLKTLSMPAIESGSRSSLTWCTTMWARKEIIYRTSAPILRIGIARPGGLPSIMTDRTATRSAASSSTMRCTGSRSIMSTD